MFASARRQISWMVVSRKPRSANTSPAASSNRWRVSRERAAAVMRITASGGRGTVVRGPGSQGDGGILPGCRPLGAEDEGDRGRGKEPDHQGPHHQRHGTARDDGGAKKPT